MSSVGMRIRRGVAATLTALVIASGAALAAPAAYADDAAAGPQTPEVVDAQTSNDEIGAPAEAEETDTDPAAADQPAESEQPAAPDAAAELPEPSMSDEPEAEAPAAAPTDQPETASRSLNAAPLADPVVWEPQITVALADGTPLAPDATVYKNDVIVVQGSGFDPLSHPRPAEGRPPVTAGDPTGNYVVFGNFAAGWKPSSGATGTQRSVGSQLWAMTDATFGNLDPRYAPAVEPDRVVLNTDGTFEARLTAKAAAASPGTYGVFTYVAGGGANDPAQELELRLNYVDSERPVTWTPEISVTLADGTPVSSGDTVYVDDELVVRGSGFDPLSHPRPADGRPPVTAGDPTGNYVVFGDFGADWKPSAGAKGDQRSVGDQLWAMTDATFGNLDPRYAPAVEPQRVVLNTDGTFEAHLTVKAAPANPGTYGVFTYVAGGGANDAAQELELRLEFSADVRPEPPAATASIAGVSVTDDGLQVDVSAENLPGPIYAALIERGTEGDLSMDTSDYAAFALPFPEVVDGATAFSLVAASNALDRSKLYEVLIWQIHSAPDSSTIYARTDVEISAAQWNALEGVEPPGPPPAPSTPSQAAGSLVWSISSGFAAYTTGNIAKGTIGTNGVGVGSRGYTFPQAVGGDWNAETQTGTVQYSGVVTFSGHGGLMGETFANPVITVVDASTGTISVSGRTYPLDLGSAVRTVGANGEVTFSGVPVLGAITGGGSTGSGSGGGSFPLDALTFTVGSVNTVNYGSTAVSNPSLTRTPAPTPPSTEGLTVVTPQDRLVEGGEIEITASGFEPNETGILVVIYSEPRLLDGNARADENGVVRWIGTLPEGLTGEHTITLQGSISVGKVITIQSGSDDDSAGSGGQARAVTAQSNDTAPAGPAGAGEDMWVWWIGALVLIVAAGGLSALLVAQRRRNGS